MSEKLSPLEKARQKIKELEKKEKEKYEKSRLRVGKIIDEHLKGKNLDSKAFKEYLKKYGSYIEKNLYKKRCLIHTK